MSELKITKGKWEYCKSELDKKHNFSILTDSGTYLIADIYRKRKYENEQYLEDIEQAEANAKLISSAPELLDMLIKLTNSNPMHDGYHENRIKAIELIKKATL